jgi:hypothetical protein
MKRENPESSSILSFEISDQAPVVEGRGGEADPGEREQSF